MLHRLLLFLITLIALFLAFRDGAWLADHALATVGRLVGNPGEHLMIQRAARHDADGSCGIRSIPNADPFAPYGQQSHHDHRAEKKAKQSERLHAADNSDQHQQEW